MGKRSQKWRQEVVEVLKGLIALGEFTNEYLALRLSETFFGETYKPHQVRNFRNDNKDLFYAKPELAPKVDTELRRFLLSAKTLPALCAKLQMKEDLTLAVAETPPADLTHFAGRNRFGETTHIWLPKTQDELVIQPREWTSHSVCSPDDGYYQVAQFHDDVEKIKIIPLGDVHYGNKEHKHEKFLATLRYIEETPGVYFFGGGDLAENALDDGRGYSYDQDVKPKSQMEDLTRFLAPVAHKCLFLHPGNHEWRTWKKAGFDPTQYIADRLQVPYYDAPVILSMRWKGHCWTAHVQHGNTGSQTKGGKMNAARRPVGFHGPLDFVVSFHTHDPMCNTESDIVEDIANCRLQIKKRWVMVAPSYLGYWGGYAHRAGYAPPGEGGCALHLFPDGEYQGYFTT